MVAEIRRYIDLLREKSFREFDNKTRRKALLVFQKMLQMVIQKSRLVVSTNNITRRQNHHVQLWK